MAAEGPRALVRDVRVLSRRIDAALQRPGSPDWIVAAAVVTVLGFLLGTAGGYGATGLLVAVAITQFVLVLAWVYGTQLVGRKGALVLGAFAAAAADVCVSVWPHARLGALLGVFALAVPLLFVHQLARGVARHHIVVSLGAIAGMAIGTVGLASLLQLRHEFADQTSPSRVVTSVVAITAGGLVLSLLVDAISPYPRFDPAVRRGAFGVLASTGLGASIGYLALQAPGRHDFSEGRGALVGAILGALVALLSVAASFAAHSVEPLEGAPPAMSRWARMVLVGVMPIALLAPVAFLICLAVRV
ncbi:MAG TPA: hypothetical protein VGL26_08395 [Jatrophihabitans sp.]